MTCTFYTPEMLRELKDAYLRIVTGQNVIVVIDQNGERIEYQKANLTELANLIRTVEAELARCAGGLGAYQPLRVYY